MNVSLVGGWLPWTLGVLAVAAVGLAVAGRWVRTVLALGGWVGLALAVDAATSGRILGTALPSSVFLAGALPVAAVVAFTSVVSGPWWRRTAAVAAVPLVLVAGLVWLDSWFDYYPTLGSVLAPPPPAFPGATPLGSPGGHLISIGARREPGRGQLFSIDYPAPRSRFSHQRGVVWLPPAWYGPERSHLGVIVLLAGVPGDPRSWLHGTKVVDTANAYATRHHGLAPVLVFADDNGSWTGDTECVDGPRGRAETYLAEDVPRDVHRLLGVSADPRRWAVGGLSEGGTCSLVLVLRHHHLAQTFLDISGEVRPEIGDRTKTVAALYGGDDAQWWQHDPGALLRFQRGRDRGFAGVLLAGTGDGQAQRAVARLAPLVRAAGMALHVDVGHRGSHNYHYFQYGVDHWFDWLAGRVDPHHRGRDRSHRPLCVVRTAQAGASDANGTAAARTRPDCVSRAGRSGVSGTIRSAVHRRPARRSAAIAPAG